MSFDGRQFAADHRQPRRPIVGACEGDHECTRMCEIVHPEDASVLATFGRCFYEGRPAVTENVCGEGRAYYVATDAHPCFLGGFYGTLRERCEIAPVLESPEGVEVRRRTQKDGSFLFVLNHTVTEVQVEPGERGRRELTTGWEMTGAAMLPPDGVLVLEEL